MWLWCCRLWRFCRSIENFVSVIRGDWARWSIISGGRSISLVSGYDWLLVAHCWSARYLGLYSHAAKHYEQVLELAEKEMDADVRVNTFFLADVCSLWLQNNFAREAAYNLSLIYVTTGAMPLAETLYQRWLTIWIVGGGVWGNYLANCSYLLYMRFVVCIRVT